MVQRLAERIRINPADGVDRPSLPYHQIGLLVDQQLVHTPSQILGGLARADQGDDLDGNSGQAMGERGLEPGRIGRAGTVRAGQDRGTGPQHRDGQPPVLGDGRADFLQLVVSKQQIAGNLARLPLREPPAR